MAKKLPTDDLFEKSTMTFGEHLEELRVCLFRGVVGMAFGCLIGFFVANWVVRFFQGPLERAMADYYVEKAVVDFGLLIGKTPDVEVKRQILDEGLIPEPVQMAPAQIADALRTTYPQTFSELKISPNWFTPGDFLSGGSSRLCKQLVAG
jgi:sec-independent protein translocase protein TatC